MNVIQSYQQGGMHKKYNQPCQDRTYYLSDNDVYVIALADGAGSSKYTHSAEGAECVTATISKFFCNNFDKFYEKTDNEELCEVITVVCHNALKKKSADLKLDDIIRLSSTLLCVAIKDNRVIICHIGDGVIGKLTPKGTEVVSAPENGEFAGTTYFITNPNAQRYIRIIKENLDNTIAYFLMSDGTADYVYNKFENNFHNAAKKMSLMSLENNGQTALEDTIHMYMIEMNSNSDDCSFICISVDILETTDILSDNSDENKAVSVNKIEKLKNTDVFSCEDTSSDAETNIMQKKQYCIILLLVIGFLGILFLLIPKNGSDNNEMQSTQNVSDLTMQYIQEESLSYVFRNNEKESSSTFF